MGSRQDKQAGDALEAVLRARGSGAEAGSGRVLLLALLRLHAAGGLTFGSADAVHGLWPQAEPGAVIRSGAVSPATTAPAYNMGQSICISRDEQ
ncbi:MAG: hypothetical protein Q7U89_08465 [Coriobacteriia bacterium]|nr:hypothetical protein [Coriobacteriia bacterium]